jgi:hypothetical protein
MAAPAGTCRYNDEIFDALWIAEQMALILETGSEA